MSDYKEIKKPEPLSMGPDFGKENLKDYIPKADVLDDQEILPKENVSPETPPTPGMVVYLMPDGTVQTRFLDDKQRDAAPFRCADGWAIPLGREEIELYKEELPRNITHKESPPGMDIGPDGNPISSRWVPDNPAF